MSAYTVRHIHLFVHCTHQGPDINSTSRKPVDADNQKTSKTLEQQREFVVKKKLNAARIETLVKSKSFLPMVTSIRTHHAVAMQLEILRLKGVKKPVVLQIDQHGCRMPLGVEVVPCLTTHGSFYLTDPPRLLSASDVLALQGLSLEEQRMLGLTSIPQSLQRFLAGNMWSGPVTPLRP